MRLSPDLSPHKAGKRKKSRAWKNKGQFRSAQTGSVAEGISEEEATA